MTSRRFHLLPIVALAVSLLCGVSAADTSPYDEFQALRKEAQQLLRDKQLDEARTVHARMYALVHPTILDGEESHSRKMTAGLTIAGILIGDGEYEQVVTLCERLGRLPETSAGDRARIQCVLGDRANARGFQSEAVDLYEQALKLPDLSPADKAHVLSKLGTFYWRSDRNPERLRPVVERMLALDEPSLRIQNWLRILGTHQHPNTSYRRPETIEFAWSHFLQQPDIASKDKATAYTELIEAKIVLGKTAEATSLAADARADEDLPLDTRLMAQLVSLALTAPDTLTAERIDQARTALEASPLDLYNALFAAAGALKQLDEGQIARACVQQAETMANLPVPRHTSRFMPTAPLGAAGWFASDLLDNPDYRVGGFRDYSQKDAAALVTDVNAERAVGDATDKKAVYVDNTAFYMVHDTAGWHIFVLCGEPDLAGRLDRGESLGALEMYFAPTPDHPYYQWIINLEDGKVSTYDWSSPHRGFRLAAPHLETDTRILDNRIGVHIFFPWEMLYDTLPFDTAGPWLFEVIRWSPAGGLSWSGGRVHNTGKWGEIDWQAPPPEHLSRLRTNLLRKGWRHYRQARQRLVTNYWASRDFGDPGFMRDALDPEVKRLDDLGAVLESADQPDDADITRLYREALGDWMAFDYTVSALRRTYLEQLFTTPAEPAER